MPQIAEVDSFLLEADQLTRKSKLTAGERSRVNVLLARSKAMRERPGNNQRAATKFSDMAKHRPDLRAYAEWLLTGSVRPETRDMGAGTQSYGESYSLGSSGGYLVPQEMYGMVIDAIAQADPLFDDNVVRLVTEPALTPLRARPVRISGWDSSTASAAQVTENAQESAVTPTVGGGTLNGFLFREEIAMSVEFEQDADIFLRIMDLMVDHYQQSFAHGIGAALATGSGSGAPQGIVTGAANSGVTTGAAGSLAGGDFEEIYFAVNRAYRNRPKCAWLMPDTLYLQARKAIDSASRPLINIENDREMIFGKPVLISPTMSSTAGSKGIIFGDLSHFVVRLSGMQIVRTIQTAGAGSVTYGACSYKGRMRADSTVFDPSGGATPPIVYATLHS